MTKLQNKANDNGYILMYNKLWHRTVSYDLLSFVDGQWKNTHKNLSFYKLMKIINL